MSSSRRRLDMPYWMGLILPSLVIILGLQLLRVFIPSLAWYLRDTTGLSSMRLAPYAFGAFLLGFMAAPLRRALGPRWALWLTAGGVAGVRVLEQLSTDPGLDLWVSIVGTGLFLMFLPIFMGHLRAMSEASISRWPYGLALGLALDNALRGAFGGLDLSWIGGWLPATLVIALALAILWLLWREHYPSSASPSDAGWAGAIPLLAIGPYLLLQLLVYQSQGWVEAVGKIASPLGLLAVTAGNLATAAGIFAGLSDRRSRHPVLALAVAIYLPVALSGIARPGASLLISLLVGQLLMGWSWAMISSVTAAPERPGLGRTTVGMAGGMLLFLSLAFGYYLALDVRLPFSREIFPIAAALMFGLCFLLPSWRMDRLASLEDRNPTGVAAAASLLLIPLALWAFTGRGPVAQPPSGWPIKIMTYNIHSGFSSAGRQDPEAIAQVIEASGADIVALQEVSRVRLLDGEADLAGWLSRRLDLPFLFHGTEEPIWGNALLSRFPVVEWGWGDLPRLDTLIGRGFLWAKFELGGPEPLLVIVTHLHHIEGDSQQRQAQVPPLLRAWNQRMSSVILGDLNAEPGSPEIEFFVEAGLVDSWAEAGAGPGYTFSARDPYQRIDWIWHSPDLMAVAAEVPQSQASDHLPVLATIDRAP